MIRDLKLQNTEDGSFDIIIENGTVLFESSWKSHIVTSLFEDQRLPESLAKRQPYYSKGGSPAEILLNFDSLKRGSLLWSSLKKSVVDQDLINQVQIKSEKALEWMTKNEYVKDLLVDVSINSPTSINISVKITNNDNTTESINFNNISSI